MGWGGSAAAFHPLRSALARRLPRRRNRKARRRQGRCAPRPRRSRRAFDGEIKNFAVAVHSFNELYSARQIHETVQQEFGARLAAEGLQLPGLRAFEIRFAAWKQEYAAGLLKMMDPDGFRSKMRTSGSYAHMAPYLNALWQIDASPVDALCVDGRHSIYVCIDIWSRRVVLFVSKTPRAEAVQFLMRKAILAWGVPDAVKNRQRLRLRRAQHGAPLRQASDRGHPLRRLLPLAEGVVERAIRTFQSDCATMLPASSAIRSRTGRRSRVARPSPSASGRPMRRPSTSPLPARHCSRRSIAGPTRSMPSASMAASAG